MDIKNLEKAKDLYFKQKGFKDLAKRIGESVSLKQIDKALKFDSDAVIRVSDVDKVVIQVRKDLLTYIALIAAEFELLVDGIE